MCQFSQKIVALKQQWFIDILPFDAFTVKAADVGGEYSKLN